MIVRAVSACSLCHSNCASPALRRCFTNQRGREAWQFSAGPDESVRSFFTGAQGGSRLSQAGTPPEADTQEPEEAEAAEPQLPEPEEEEPHPSLPAAYPTQPILSRRKQPTLPIQAIFCSWSPPFLILFCEHMLTLIGYSP